jgi:hypothetical protein
MRAAWWWYNAPVRKPPPLEVRMRALGVEALEEGERSEKVRIRGPEALFRVLEELSPRERGLALIKGLEVLGRWPGPEEGGDGG